jgi:hypothetical protein
MMRLFAAALVLVTLVAVGIERAAGHPHHDPIATEDAIDIATQIVEELIRTKHIEASWKAVVPSRAERRVRGHGIEWIVTLTNARASDPDNRTLYIFLDELGDYLSFSYTAR